MLHLRSPVGCSPSCSNQSHSRRSVFCQATASQQQVSRRDFALLGTSGLLLAGGFGFADKAQAVAVCADQDTAEEGDACRQRLLAADEGRNFKGSYKTLTAGPERRTAGNVPVSELGAQYVKDTQELTDAIETYITIDVYDKKRSKLIKQLKTDALSWVSKYARGGSVRAQSAREIYIGVDAVLGHLASNGLAPLPSNKAKTVRGVIAQGLAFLDQGK